jgi:hypothetical protein
MVRNRAILAIAILCALLLSVGCADDPTPTERPLTYAPTKIPTQTPTPAASATPTPASPTLSRAVVDRIGVGLHAEMIGWYAGIEPTDPPAPYPTEYAIEEGGVLRLSYATGLGDIPFVMSFEILGSTADRSVRARPDAEPVRDFALEVSANVVGLHDAVSATAVLERFGPPLEDKTEAAVDEFGPRRTICFETFSVMLYQGPSAPDPDLWGVWTVSTTSPDAMTPRGLKVGMTYLEVIGELGTGDLQYTASILKPTSMSILSTDPNHMEDSILLKFAGDAVVEIIINYLP